MKYSEIPANVIVCLYSRCLIILEMAGVSSGNETVCLQCDCQYESRNTLVIKVGLSVCLLSVDKACYYGTPSIAVLIRIEVRVSNVYIL